MVIHTKTFFAPACRLRQKILCKTKLSHSTLLHPRALHTSSYTSKYNNISAPHWFYSNTNLSRINFLLVESEKSQFRHKFESGHFPFIICSHIHPLTRIGYISLHTTKRVAYHLSPNYFQVLPHYQIWEIVRVSYSGFPTLYYFDILLNDIPFVNSFLMIIPTLHFELQILNQHCVTTVPQIAAG